MSDTPPIKLYLLITGVIILVLVILGLLIRNYVSEKFSVSSSVNATKQTSKYHEPDEAKQSRAISYFGLIILVILMIMLITFKLTQKYTKN